MAKERALMCCVCSGAAGIFQQHWNRDEGFGICSWCAAQQLPLEGLERMAMLYGKEGVNYAMPTQSYHGRRYAVMAATGSQTRANKFIQAHPGACVLTVNPNGLIILANKEDLGQENSVEA